MTKETITLSHQEFDRLSVIQVTQSERLTQAEAALQLNLTVRQVKRLVRAFRCFSRELSPKV